MLKMMLRSLHWLPVASILLLTACDSVEERAQGHYENAIALLESKDPKKAALEFRNAIELNNDFVEARYELAKLQEEDRNLSNALQNYLKIIDIDPNHVGALVHSSNIMLIAGHLDRAITNIEHAYKLAPKDLDVLLGLALARLRQDRYDEAVEAAEAALKIAPANGKAGLILASNSFRNGKYSEAEGILDRFLEVNPYDISLNILRIRVLDALGDKEKTAAHLQNMTRIYPESLEVRRLLARWYIAQKDLPNSEIQLRKLRDLEPESTEALTNLVQFVTDTRGLDAAREEVLGQIQKAATPQLKIPLQVMLAEMDYEAGRTEEARKTLKDILDNEVTTGPALEARLLLGQFSAREEKFDEALASATSVLAIDRKNALALGLKAAVQSEQNNHEQAVIDVRAAMNESPRNIKLRRLAARIYSRNGNNDLALESLATTVVLSGYEPGYAQEYAAALRTTNQTRAIEAVLSESARRFPKNRELLAALAAARLRLQDWTGAEQAAAALRALDSGLSADQIRAVVLTGQQRYGESIELLQRLAESNTADASIMAALTQVYIKAGQTSQARAYIEQVLQKNPKNTAALRINGALHALEDDLAGAEKLFRDAILADPLDSLGFLVLGRFLRDHDRLTEAEEIIRAGVANVPGNVALHIHLADLLLLRGEFDQAIQEFEAVYDLQPDSLIAANNLASMLADFHANNPELVDRAYAIAQRLASSTNPSHMDTYGWILYLRGEYTLALRSLKTAAEQLRDDPWVQYHAGMVYIKLNQPASARKHLQAALDAGGSRMFPLRQQAQTALDGLKDQ